jgi:SOS-response transcriptional repressor LexA
MANPNTEIIYEFVRAYIEKHGYGPTQREIANGCYLNRATVYFHLLMLEMDGRIAREPGKARSITLVKR